MGNRRQWFVDRIGKRVFRTPVDCCEHCTKVNKEGLVIHDEQHAQYLFDVECETPVKYFDKDEDNKSLIEMADKAEKLISTARGYNEVDMAKD